MFSCVWLHFKKIFGKYFLMFGCILENTIKTHFLLVAHIFSHFLTFSQLPNKHIMSFIPKNSNKTQDKSISRWENPEGHLRTRWDHDRRFARDRRDRDRNLADFDDRDRRRSARLRSREASIARSRSTQFRSRRDRDRGASVWVVPAQWRLDRAVHVWEVCACERGSGNQLKWK